MPAHALVAMCRLCGCVQNDASATLILNTGEIHETMDTRIFQVVSAPTQKLKLLGWFDHYRRSFNLLRATAVFIAAALFSSHAHAEFSCPWGRVDLIQIQNYGTQAYALLKLENQPWKSIGRIPNEPETEARLALATAAKGAGWEVQLVFQTGAPVNCSSSDYSVTPLKIRIR